MGRAEVGRRRRSSPVVAVMVVLVAVVVAGAALVLGGEDRGQPAAARPRASLSPAGVIPTSTSTPTPTPATPGLVRVVALGDSVTAGSSCGCDSFPALYTQALHHQTGRTVQLDNRGAAGNTTTTVLDDLASSSGASSVADADVVLVTIGANDFDDVAGEVQDGSCGTGLDCAKDDLGALRSHLTTLLARIHQLRGNRPTAVLVTGYWNVYEDGDVADHDYPASGRRASTALTLRVNGIEQSVAVAGAGTYVDLYEPFEGSAGDQDPTGLLADDGDHPNAEGHKAIAAALLRAGTAPLDLSS